MVNLNKMYDGVVNSPETYLTQNLAADATIIYVADSSVFGSIPNLAVIGTDQNAETILIKSKRSDGGLEVQRALEGSAKRWEKTTAIARNFTNFDYQQIRDNIEKLNKGKQESLTAGNNIQITNGRISATDTKYDDTKIKEDISELKNSQLAKASQTEAESGVDNTKYMTPQTTKQAIQKLSPKQDLSDYAMKKDIKTKLSDLIDDSTHRIVTDKEKSTWNKKLSNLEGVNANLAIVKDASGDKSLQKALEELKENKASVPQKIELGNEVTCYALGYMRNLSITLSVTLTNGAFIDICNIPKEHLPIYSKDYGQYSSIPFNGIFKSGNDPSKSLLLRMRDGKLTIFEKGNQTGTVYANITYIANTYV